VTDATQVEAAWNAAQSRASSYGATNLADKLDTLIRNLASSQDLWRNAPQGSMSEEQSFQDHAFDLDGARTASQMLTEGREGSC